MATVMWETRENRKPRCGHPAFWEARARMTNRKPSGAFQGRSKHKIVDICWERHHFPNHFTLQTWKFDGDRHLRNQRKPKTTLWLPSILGGQGQDDQRKTK